MLNFLRNLRRNNMNTKYFKYAIGEIVLVVIGILIALSINNWNEHRKKVDNEKELMISLANELINNIDRLDSVLTQNIKYSSRASALVDKINLGVSEFEVIDINASLNYLSIDINTPVLSDIVLKNADVLVNRKDLINDFRQLMYEYEAATKGAYFIDEFWNSKVTTFFIDCGFYSGMQNDKSEIVTIEMINAGGYSLQQLKALIKIKDDLQLVWQSNLSEALNKSKQLLQKLKIEP